MKRRTLVMIAVAAAASALLARRRQLRWGAVEDEQHGYLPGDDLIPEADLVATRAISVNAPADRVWPWLAQMGQGRGGLYSYDFLENLVGCDIHSADAVLPEHQDIRTGDVIKLAPDIGLDVVSVEPQMYLVLRGGVPLGEAAPPYEFTWSFTLRERADGKTRLLVRERYRYSKWWAPALVEPVEVVDSVMTRKMLLGIKDRAERN